MVYKKESALPPAVTVGQGSKGRTSYNLYYSCNIVKSDAEKFREYESNTVTAFKLMGFLKLALSQSSLSNYFPSISKCHSSTIGSIVSLVRNPESKRAYYNHVETCGNVLCCPLCSARIMGRRRTEIENAVKSWFDSDPFNTCFMLTFTASHCLHLSLSDFLVRFKTALKMFWKDGRIVRFLSSASRFGRITAMEFQYGLKNGWHPHQHVLLFCRRCVLDVDLFRTVWLSCLLAVGLSAIAEIGLVITDGHDPSISGSYLSKIGMEMAFSNLKRGRGAGHYSPMQLLFEAASGEVWAKDRFLELLTTSRGVHVLQWSRGLKSRFGICDVSDHDIAAGQADIETESFLHLCARDYRFRLSSTDRALLRNFAAANDLDFAMAFLDRLSVTYSVNVDDFCKV